MSAFGEATPLAAEQGLIDVPRNVGFLSERSAIDFDLHADLIDRTK